MSNTFKPIWHMTNPSMRFTLSYIYGGIWFLYIFEYTCTLIRINSEGDNEVVAFSTHLIKLILTLVYSTNFNTKCLLWADIEIGSGEKVMNKTVHDFWGTEASIFSRTVFV